VVAAPLERVEHGLGVREARLVEVEIAEAGAAGSAMSSTSPVPHGRSMV